MGVDTDITISFLQNEKTEVQNGIFAYKRNSSAGSEI
jgi:hypothetical protein